MGPTDEPTNATTGDPSRTDAASPPPATVIDALLGMIENVLLETGMSEAGAAALVQSIATLHERGGVEIDSTLDTAGKVDINKVIGNSGLLSVLTVRLVMGWVSCFLALALALMSH